MRRGGLGRACAPLDDEPRRRERIAAYRRVGQTEENHDALIYAELRGNVADFPRDMSRTTVRTK